MVKMMKTIIEATIEAVGPEEWSTVDVAKSIDIPPLRDERRPRSGHHRGSRSKKLPLRCLDKAHRGRIATHRNSASGEAPHTTLSVYGNTQSEKQGRRYHHPRHDFILRPAVQHRSL